MKKKEEKLKNENFIEAYKSANNGIIYSITTQKNIKIQLVIAVAVMILSLFYKLSTSEFLCLLFAVFMVIFAELINTAIETVVDLYVDVYHPKAKIAKDVGAGAVLLAAINSVIVAYFLFFNETELAYINERVFTNMVSSPIHLVFVALIVTIITIITFKAIASTNKYKLINSKFIPSGQVALTFAILTAIWLISNNIVVFALALILSILILINRIENKMYTLGETIFGAFMGILIVLLIYGLIIL